MKLLQSALERVVGVDFVDHRQGPAWSRISYREARQMKWLRMGRREKDHEREGYYRPLEEWAWDLDQITSFCTNLCIELSKLQLSRISEGTDASELTVLRLSRWHGAWCRTCPHAITILDLEKTRSEKAFEHHDPITWICLLLWTAIPFLMQLWIHPRNLLVIENYEINSRF